MELWIRSQDKCILMKASYVYVAREEVCAYDENKCWSAIGVYSSQERTLEVLDEIQTKIAKLSYQEHFIGKDFIGIESKVYEMPKE